MHDQGGRDAETSLTQAVDDWCQFDQMSFRGTIQNTDRASYGQAQSVRCLYAVAVIHQHKIRIELQRWQNRITFTRI